MVSTLAEAGVLTTTAQNGLSTGAIAPNILGAGVINGKTYGVPIGANTLALYYNKKSWRRRGSTPPRSPDWATLTAALAKVKATGKKGITFSGIGTEEGSFQFLPWFWGAGANLTNLDSPQAVAALTLWTDLAQGRLRAELRHPGHPDHQLAGVRRPASSRSARTAPGSWPTPRRPGSRTASSRSRPRTAARPRCRPAVSSSPSRCRRTRPATPPRQKIVSCLTSADNIVTTDNTLNYIVATQARSAGQQVAADPALSPGSARSGAAKARTGDNLGTKYPKISQQLWTAVQKALSGAATPASALAAAQSAATAAINK